MQHHHHQRELFRQNAEELHRQAAISYLVANKTRRSPLRVRETRLYGAVARRVWAARGIPGLNP